MRIRIAVPEAHVNPHVIDAALESVTRLNESLVRSGQSPTARELVRAGAIWKPEPPGDEFFDNGATIAARGHGDCDDWAPLHAGSLRATGEDPGAVARVVRSGPTTYHAIVQRSDGSIDDPSIAAGMKRKSSVAGDDGSMPVWAQDPHDGRIYTGSLLPTVAPLSGHCGPGIQMRAAHVVGCGTLYEARCDVPIQGSPLLRVRSYWRHKARRVCGSVPYALSSTAQDYSPQGAMSAAIVGAILCGDAAQLPLVTLDRYKLMATHWGLAGHTPGQVREMLMSAMRQDLAAHAHATGQDPRGLTERLKHELAREGVHVAGTVVGDIFGDIAHVASGVVDTVSNVVNDVAQVANVVPWGDIIHGVQAAVSVVPGLGTAVSDIVAAAETAYESAAALLHGNPLEAAIHAAYNFALASIPGASAIRIVLDPVVESIIALTVRKEPVESAVLDGLLRAVPDQPNIGGVSPRSIAASLAHLIVNHLGMKHTGTASAPRPSGRPSVVKAKAPPRAIPMHFAPHRAPAPRAVPMRMAARKPLGVPHAALHVSLAPRAAAPLRPGSPGAPPGATHWMCKKQKDGTWACRWV